MISRTSMYVVDANYAGDGEFYVRGVVFDKGDKKTVAVRLKNQIEREIYWGDAYKDNPVLAAAKISQENEDLSRKGVHNKNTLPDLINKGLMKAFEEKQFDVIELVSFRQGRIRDTGHFGSIFSYEIANISYVESLLEHEVTTFQVVGE